MNQFLNTQADIKQIAWLPETNCKGDCQQGRYCRCTPDDDAKPPMTGKDAGIALLLVFGAWAVPVGLVAVLAAVAQWVAQ